MTDFVIKMIFKARADCDKIQMVDNADKLGVILAFPLGKGDRRSGG